MFTWLIKSPTGIKQIVQAGHARNTHDSDDVLWCWTTDGEPTIDMSNLENIDVKFLYLPAYDDNGKKLYTKIIFGPNKKQVKLVEKFYKERILVNKVTNEEQISKKLE